MTARSSLGPLCLMLCDVMVVMGVSGCDRRDGDDDGDGVKIILMVVLGADIVIDEAKKYINMA